jgi:hypothetical protein
MPVKRAKKKAPLSSSSKSAASTVSASSVSRKITQTTISTFHVLLKQKAIIKRQLRNDNDNDGKLQKRLDEVDQKLKDIGGLDAYQAASRLGQTDDRGGDSSKVLVEWLKDEPGSKGKARIQTYESHPLK